MLLLLFGVSIADDELVPVPALPVLVFNGNMVLKAVLGPVRRPTLGTDVLRAIVEVDVSQMLDYLFFANFPAESAHIAASHSHCIIFHKQHIRLMAWWDHHCKNKQEKGIPCKRAQVNNISY